jgi:CBS domain-containing protein
MKFSAYILFAALYTGVVYPVFAYLLWNGPLARLGVQDYAGSLGVHALGGIVGLCGAAALGRRKITGSGHDVPMMGLGALLLMFSWFGFNLGSVPSYGQIATDLPLVALNTMASIAGGILGSLLATWTSEKPDPVITPNGGLAGAVAICSGVHLVSPLYAVLIGVLAGAQIPWTSRLIKRVLKLDDPCDVGAVHALPGVMGAMLAGIWAPMIAGGFHGYTISFRAQLIGTVVTVAYAFVASAVIFPLIKLITGLRVAEPKELAGLDLAEHGQAAYPELLAAGAGAPGTLHVLSGVRVGDVMGEAPVVSPEDSLEAVQEIMFAREMFALPVLDEDSELAGIISIGDVTRIHRDERPRVRVAAVFTREVQVAFPDQTMHEVVERMRERHLANFPVVSRSNERQVLGIVTKADIVTAYRRVAVANAV